MSNKKRITVKIDTTYKYIRLWNGLFNLTPKEVCHVEIKKIVAKHLGIIDYNTLNNYVKRFKKKGVIIKKGKYYSLNKLLDPETASVEIVIKYADNR